MINLEAIVHWMLSELERDGCVYQDDVVDFLTKSSAENFLTENADGNLVLDRSVLNAFKKQTELNVVWVKPDRYWRYRVAEDEPGREARG